MPSTDPRIANSGAGTGLWITGVNVNIEPVSTFGILDVNVAAHPEMTDQYLYVVNRMDRMVTEAAARLGAAKNTIATQKTFLASLSDTITRSVGTLVDADMEQENARLKALQAQQSLGTQALSIANGSDRMILQLFTQ